MVSGIGDTGRVHLYKWTMRPLPRTQQVQCAYPASACAAGGETEHMPKWTEDVAARLRDVNARFVVLDPCSAGEAAVEARQRLAAALQAGLDTAQGGDAADKQAAVVQLARFLRCKQGEGS